MFRFFPIFLFFFPVLSLATPSPSFSCEKATSEIERAICDNAELSTLDSQMANAYRAFVSKLPSDQKSTALKLQRLWIKNRHKNCSAHQTLVDCVQENYKIWLDAINNQVLFVAVPLQADVLFQDPLSESIQWKLEKTSNSEEAVKDYELSEHFRLYSINKGNQLTVENGSLEKYSDLDYESNLPSHLYYYLTTTGMRYRAYLMTKEGSGGRCYSELVKTLKFVGKNADSSYGEVILLEGDYACDTYEKSVRNWKPNGKGELEFYFVNFRSFYQQTPFIELIQTTVNAEKEFAKKEIFLDQSVITFEGRPYTQIISSLIKTVEKISSTLEKTDLDTEDVQPQNTHTLPPEDATCSETIPNYYAYTTLKESLMSHFIGFKQLQFMGFNVLKKEDFEVGKPYKPLIEKALFYLQKLKETPDWETKLLEAASKFPEIQATANYFFEFDMPLESNPFEDAGFYTDGSCYADAPSPLHHASLEEWIYLFWARRVKDDSLDVTNKLLERALLLMN